MSKVATLEEGISTRSSPSLGFSTPPLKKKVTWAYFWVSAMRSCVLPSLERYSPRVFFSVSGGLTTSRLGKGLVILRHADKVDMEIALPAREAGKIGLNEGAGELAGTVGAEVKEDHAVPLA